MNNKLVKLAKSLFGIKSQEQNIALTDTSERFYPLRLVDLLGRGFEFGTDSTALLIDAYGGNPYVYAVIDRIVSRGIMLKKEIINAATLNESQDIERFFDIFKEPFQRQTFSEFLYRYYATYLITGEVFVVKNRPVGMMEPAEYFIPINYNVTILDETDGNPDFYTVKFFNESHLYAANDVLHIKKPNLGLDTVRGFSALTAGRKVWESDNEVWASEASLHRNKGISGVLFNKGSKAMLPDEKTEIQRQYDTDYTGVRNFGKVKVSTQELGFLQMGMNPNDLKSIEARIDHLRAICSLYNVDPKLFGDSAGSTYNNMPDAKRGLITDAVLPLVKTLDPLLINFISSDFTMNSIEWNVVKEDIPELARPNKELSDKVVQEVNAGILNTDEAKEILYPNMI